MPTKQKQNLALATIKPQDQTVGFKEWLRLLNQDVLIHIFSFIPPIPFFFKTLPVVNKEFFRYFFNFVTTCPLEEMNYFRELNFWDFGTGILNPKNEEEILIMKNHLRVFFGEEGNLYFNLIQKRIFEGTEIMFAIHFFLSKKSSHSNLSKKFASHDVFPCSYLPFIQPVVEKIVSCDILQLFQSLRTVIIPPILDDSGSLGAFFHKTTPKWDNIEMDYRYKSQERAGGRRPKSENIQSYPFTMAPKKCRRFATLSSLVASTVASPASPNSVCATPSESSQSVGGPKTSKKIGIPQKFVFIGWNDLCVTCFLDSYYSGPKFQSVIPKVEKIVLLWGGPISRSDEDNPVNYRGETKIFSDKFFEVTQQERDNLENWRASQSVSADKKAETPSKENESTRLTTGNQNPFNLLAPPMTLEDDEDEKVVVKEEDELRNLGLMRLPPRVASDPVVCIRMESLFAPKNLQAALNNFRVNRGIVSPLLFYYFSRLANSRSAAELRKVNQLIGSTIKNGYFPQNFLDGDCWFKFLNRRQSVTANEFCVSVFESVLRKYEMQLFNIQPSQQATKQTPKKPEKKSKKGSKKEKNSPKKKLTDAEFEETDEKIAAERKKKEAEGPLQYDYDFLRHSSFYQLMEYFNNPENLINLSYFGSMIKTLKWDVLKMSFLDKNISELKKNSANGDKKAKRMLELIKKRWEIAFSVKILGEYLLDVHSVPEILKTWKELDQNFVFLIFGSQSHHYLIKFMLNNGEISTENEKGLLNTPAENGVTPLTLLIQSSAENSNLAVQILTEKDIIDTVCKTSSKQEKSKSNETSVFKFNLKKVDHLQMGLNSKTGLGVSYIQQFVQRRQYFEANLYMMFLLRQYPDALAKMLDFEIPFEIPKEILKFPILAKKNSKQFKILDDLAENTNKKLNECLNSIIKMNPTKFFDFAALPRIDKLGNREPEQTTNIFQFLDKFESEIRNSCVLDFISSWRHQHKIYLEACKNYKDVVLFGTENANVNEKIQILFDKLENEDPLFQNFPQFEGMIPLVSDFAPHPSIYELKSSVWVDSCFMPLDGLVTQNFQHLSEYNLRSLNILDIDKFFELGKRIQTIIEQITLQNQSNEQISKGERYLMTEFPKIGFLHLNKIDEFFNPSKKLPPAFCLEDDEMEQQINIKKTKLLQKQSQLQQSAQRIMNQNLSLQANFQNVSGFLNFLQSNADSDMDDRVEINVESQKTTFFTPYEIHSRIDSDKLDSLQEICENFKKFSTMREEHCKIFNSSENDQKNLNLERSQHTNDRVIGRLRQIQLDIILLGLEVSFLCLHYCSKNVRSSLEKVISKSFVNTDDDSFKFFDNESEPISKLPIIPNSDDSLFGSFLCDEEENRKITNENKQDIEKIQHADEKPSLLNKFRSTLRSRREEIDSVIESIKKRSTSIIFPGEFGKNPRTRRNEVITKHKKKAVVHIFIDQNIFYPSNQKDTPTKSNEFQQSQDSLDQSQIQNSSSSAKLNNLLFSIIYHDHSPLFALEALSLQLMTSNNSETKKKRKFSYREVCILREFFSKLEVKKGQKENKQVVSELMSTIESLCDEIPKEIEPPKRKSTALSKSGKKDNKTTKKEVASSSSRKRKSKKDEEEEEEEEEEEDEEDEEEEGEEEEEEEDEEMKDEEDDEDEDEEESKSSKKKKKASAKKPKKPTKSSKTSKKSKKPTKPKPKKRKIEEDEEQDDESEEEQIPKKKRRKN